MLFHKSVQTSCCCFKKLSFKMNVGCQVCEWKHAVFQDQTLPSPARSLQHWLELFLTQEAPLQHPLLGKPLSCFHQFSHTGPAWIFCFPVMETQRIDEQSWQRTGTQTEACVSCDAECGCSTHSLHQDKLCAADERGVNLCCFLSEDTDTLLQPSLLHLCRHIVLQPIEGVGFLSKKTTRAVRKKSFLMNKVL